MKDKNLKRGWNIFLRKHIIHKLITTPQVFAPKGQRQPKPTNLPQTVDLGILSIKDMQNIYIYIYSIPFKDLLTNNMEAAVKLKRKEKKRKTAAFKIVQTK